MKYKCATQSEAVKSSTFVQSIHPQYKPNSSCFEEALNFNLKKLEEKNNTVVYNVVKKNEMDVNINEIIGTYFEDSNSTTDNYIKEKRNKKQVKDNTKKKEKIGEYKEISMLKINSLSQKIIQSFDQTLQKKLSDQNQLNKYREKQKREFLKILCYGFQQIKGQKKKISECQQKLVNLSQDEILKYLLELVQKIDISIIKNRQTNNSVPSISLQSQWKFILRICSAPQNDLIRKSILNGKLSVQTLVCGEEKDMLQFLPKEKKEKLMAKYEYILRQSTTQEKNKILLQQEQDPTLRPITQQYQNKQTFQKDQSKENFKRKSTFESLLNEQDYKKQKPSKKSKL